MIDSQEELEAVRVGDRVTLHPMLVLSEKQPKELASRSSIQRFDWRSGQPAQMRKSGRLQRQEPQPWAPQSVGRKNTFSGFNL